MPTQTKKFRLSLPSESQYLDVIRDFIGKIATKAGFDEEYVSKIQLAVDEACTNVIKHAYRGRARGDICLEVLLDQKKLSISVIDHGRGFDVDSVLKRDVNNFVSEFRRGGLGIHLMKILMDRVEFSIDPGHENRVTLIKYRGRKDSPEKQEEQRRLLEESHARR